MNKTDPKDLLKTGAHFGHKTSRWHPKMSPYIHSKKGNIHVIDLVKTASLLDEALQAIENVVAGGNQVLLVGTKRQSKDIIKKAAVESGMPYVTQRWLGGILTNHSTIAQRIKHLKKLEEQLESGELESKYNKLEVQRFEEEIEALNDRFGGVKEMDKLPGAVFVADIVTDKLAVHEALKINAILIGIADTNADPTLLDYVIPANDDSIKTIEFITSRIKEAIESGKAKSKTKAGAKTTSK